jgi:hypothetical protein
MKLPALAHCRLLLLFFVLAFGHCALWAQKPGSYQQEIDAWHAKRVQNLKAETGWLNLAGLFWLAEGKNSFGSAKTNKLVFPEGTIGAFAGYFERTGNAVKLIASPDADIRIKDKPVQEALIFHPDSANTPVLASGNLRWIIIKREDRIGVRLRNLKSPNLNNFHGIERFPVDSAWRVTATLRTEGQPDQLPITNVIGQTSPQKAAGQLSFTLNGQAYTLDALDEDDDLFIVFADSTTGESTYPGGRFITVKKPGKDGKVVLDFNKAYNPPCAFTNFATCPLPPSQNRLPIAVTAGEKSSGHHE